MALYFLTEWVHKKSIVSQWAFTTFQGASRAFQIRSSDPQCQSLSLTGPYQPGDDFVGAEPHQILAAYAPNATSCTIFTQPEEEYTHVPKNHLPPLQ